jgi:Ca2+-binding RTX toxin-like protein
MATIVEDGEFFEGGEGRDDVLILANAVVANGGEGDDWISAFHIPSGVRTITTELNGDDGDDHLHATLGLLDTSESNDDLPWTTSAVLDGGAGQDMLWIDLRGYLTDQMAVATGGDGDDTISITADIADFRESETGRHIEADASGGVGDDEISVYLYGSGNGALSDNPGLLSTVHGDDGADLINSRVNSGYEEAANKLYGGAGDDLIIADADAGGDLGTYALNRALGGKGDDELRLTARSIDDAKNEGFGDDGNDLIVVTAGTGSELDSIGDASNDVGGGAGDDRITANIELFGSSDPDASVINTVRGDGGDDRLSASISGEAPQSARSELYGGEGADRLTVRGGADNLLTGNQGDDTLVGSGYADRLIGGQGDDFLRGRGGFDDFVFQSIRVGERDRISDFAIGEDDFDLGQIDANAFRGGDQTFSFDESGSGGTGKVWVEDYGTRSIVHADTGRAVLDVVLLDGRGVDAGDYGAGDFIL